MATESLAKRRTPVVAAVALSACRRRFERGEATLASLAAELGVSPRWLGAMRKRQQWQAPAQSAPGRRIAARPPAKPRASGLGPGSGGHDASGPGATAIASAPPDGGDEGRRLQLVTRLWAAAGRHMSEIEAALAHAPADGAAREREARLMAMLVRVAAGLAALEPTPLAGAGPWPGKRNETGGGGNGPGANLPEDLDGFRRELAARIDGLRQRGDAG